MGSGAHTTQYRNTVPLLNHHWQLLEQGGYSVDWACPTPLQCNVPVPSGGPVILGWLYRSHIALALLQASSWFLLCYLYQAGSMLWWQEKRETHFCQSCLRLSIFKEVEVSWIPLEYCVGIYLSKHYLYSGSCWTSKVDFIGYWWQFQLHPINSG